MRLRTDVRFTLINSHSAPDDDYVGVTQECSSCTRFGARVSKESNLVHSLSRLYRTTGTFRNRSFQSEHLLLFPRSLGRYAFKSRPKLVLLILYSSDSIVLQKYHHQQAGTHSHDLGKGFSHSSSFCSGSLSTSVCSSQSGSLTTSVHQHPGHVGYSSSRTSRRAVSESCTTVTTPSQHTHNQSPTSQLIGYILWHDQDSPTPSESFSLFAQGRSQASATPGF